MATTGADGTIVGSRFRGGSSNEATCTCEQIAFTSSIWGGFDFTSSAKRNTSPQEEKSRKLVDLHEE